MLMQGPYDGKILEHYEGHFSSVWIVLFPFLRPRKIPLDKFYPGTFPTRNEILTDCEAVSWEEIVQNSDFENLSEIDVALRSAILGLIRPDNGLVNILNQTIERLKVVPPHEGEIAPHVQRIFLSRMVEFGHEYLLVSDEFGEDTKRQSIASLVDRDNLPTHCIMGTEDGSILLTTHWDSCCSFLCANDPSDKFPQLEKIACTQNTEVYWGLFPI